MSDEVEKFNNILDRLSTITYTDDEKYSLESAFDEASNDSIVDFIDFICSDDFSGKISLAKWNKLIKIKSVFDKDTVLNLYLQKNLPADSQYSRLVAGLRRIKADGNVKKTGFRELITLSALRKAVTGDNKLSNKNKGLIHGRIAKYTILDIFASWKSNGFISSSIVDNVVAGGFSRRVVSTFKAAFNKHYKKLFENYASLYPNFRIVESGSNCYIDHNRMGHIEISLSFSLNYDISVKGSFNVALSNMITSLNSQQVYIPRIRSFDKLLMEFFFNEHNITPDQFFHTTINEGYNGSSSSGNIHFGLSTHSSHHVNVTPNNSVAFIAYIDKYKSIFSTTKGSLDSIVDAISKAFQMFSDVFSTRIYKGSVYSAFIFLYHFENYIRRNIMHRGNSNATTLNGMFLTFIADYHFIVTSTRSDVFFETENSVNIPFLYFTFLVNSIYSANSRITNPLEMALYDNGLEPGAKVALLSDTLRAIQKGTSKATYNVSMMHLCNLYINFLNDIDPLLVNDPSDKILFFRHLNNTISGPLTLLNDDYDMVKFTIIGRAIEMFDGDTHNVQ